MRDGYIGLSLADLEDIRKQQERRNMGSPTRESAQSDEQRASANDRQVGGSHYRKGKLQHWDIVDRYGVPYLEGVASKYPLRWREKGGVEDLEKTLHYIDKILERPDDHYLWCRYPARFELPEAARELTRAHGCGPVEAIVVETLLCGFNRSTIAAVRKDLAAHIEHIRTSSPGTPEDGGHHARQPLEEDEPPRIGQTIVLPQGSTGEIRMVGDALHVTWHP